MDLASQPQAILCTACGGDPRRSATCKVCGGAGVGVPSVDGFLAWSDPVDDFHIALRSLKRRMNSALHFALFVIIALGAAVFAWQVMRLDDLSVLASSEFYLIGHWYVTVLWFGASLGCFLIFRVSEYSQEAKILPNWGLTKRQVAALPKVAPDHLFDVALYFSKDARDIVEDAYRIAKSLNRTEITPNALFAACLASSNGGLFMVRLGMKFDTVKGPLSRLLQQDPAGEPPVALSRDAKRVLAMSYLSAREKDRKFVDVMDVFLESFKASPSLQDVLDQIGFLPDHVLHVGEWISLQEELRDNQERFVTLAKLKPKTAMNRAMTARQTPLLDRFSEDLTLLARSGYLMPAIGRDKQIEDLLRAIESGNRSVALVGETGSGKSGIVEGLARRMVEEDVPEALFDKRLVSVSLPQVIAGGDPSLATERFMTILHDAEISGNIILVLNGIEALTGGSGGGPMDMAEVLANEIGKGYILAIMTTTPQAWTKYIERRTLGARLIKVNVPDTDVESTTRILMAMAGGIEYQQNVFFSYGALDKAANLADRFIHDKAAPAKALDLLREAGVLAHKARGQNAFVSAEDVALVVHAKTGIPVEAVTKDERQKLLALEDNLHRRVIGQEEAVTAVAQALRRARAELRESHRPIANFLFMGPTGVGKTELTKALAIEYFGSEDSMIRLDMSEYQDKSSIARMIGAPGDERGGLLTEAVRQKPFAIVLLDELEKAHPDILTLFLQVMDDGRLTDGVGRTVDFTNTIVIATSNAGSAFIQSQIAENAPLEQIKRGLMERELKGIFRPEFLNRFDGVIVFKPLTLENVVQIAKLLIAKISQKIEAKGMSFVAEDEAVRELAQAGFDPMFGARPLRRAIQERVDNILADLVLQGKVGRKDRILLKAGGQVTVERAPEL